jgi:glycosyltransferase involved in cell wall biosynthesis
MTPIISVVIPLYNNGRYISDALNSVLSQTVQDFEIIVVNDGSTDDGMKVVQTFNDLRIILINQPNHGASSARNKGAKCAKAEIIAFLDADDQWYPSFLETVIKLFENYPLAGVSATGIVEIINNKEVFQQYRTIPNNGYEGIVPDFFKSGIVGERFITSSSMAIKKSVFFEIAGFKEEATWGEDSDFSARIALKYPIAFNSKICSMYFIREPDQKAKKRITATTEHPFIKSGSDFLMQNKNADKNFSNLILYVDKLRILSARLNLMNGNVKSAREILANCKNFKVQKYVLLVWTLLPKRFYEMFGKYLFRLCISCIIIIKQASKGIKSLTPPRI